MPVLKQRNFQLSQLASTEAPTPIPTSTELAQIREWMDTLNSEYFSPQGVKVFERLAQARHHLQRLFALIDANAELSIPRFLIVEPNGHLRIDLSAYLRTTEGQKLLAGDRTAQAILESSDPAQHSPEAA